MSNFGLCPMSLVAFQNTIKIVDDDVINQSLDGIDDGMWRGYFSDGTMPSKIFVFSYVRPVHSSLRCSCIGALGGRLWW